MNFAILIIARLKGWRTLELSATLFRAGYIPEAIEVEVDRGADTVIKQTAFERFLDAVTW